MQTAFALPRRLFERSRSVSNVMYPSPSMASEFNRRVAKSVHYFLGVALWIIHIVVGNYRADPEQTPFTHASNELIRLCLLRRQDERLLLIPTTLLNEVSREGAFSCARDSHVDDAVACRPRTVGPHPPGRL